MKIGVIGVCVTLAACVSAAANKQPTSSVALGCDPGLKTAMSSNADTKVLLVKQFKQGEPLLLTGGPDTSARGAGVEGAPTATPPTAAIDLCMVKLLVGPGNPGPSGAPSTSAGIGIEVLLPSHDKWNQRIRAYGNSGWAGTSQTSLSSVASNDLHAAAAAKGFVVATSDNGHVGAPPLPEIDPSFAMNPDGSINTAGWWDFSERSLHEVAEKTKALTKLYYGGEHRYAYWDGFSTGGRQGLKLAQVFPNDFDGILVGAPAINWSKYHTAGLYGQIAMKQDLGSLIAPTRRRNPGSHHACGGAELGFLMDPLSCRYDPTLDAANICKGSTGKFGVIGTRNSKDCLTVPEATVINKAWYGQTTDGTVPAPGIDNGNSNILSDTKRLWFGWTRGTDLKSSPVGGAPGLLLAADQTALELQNPALGSEGLPALGSKGFTNATGTGKNRWLTSLDYAGLANAQAQGVRLQPQFSNINTDDPDLTRFDAAGGRIVMYQGLADEYIPAQGAINYYERVMARMGGAEAVKKFYRFYLIPGLAHSGRSEGRPFVPVPQPSSGRDEMFVALQNWVENGNAPETIEVESSNSRISLPLCVYPLKITYRGNG
jgi:hypothetical protein